MSSRNGREDQKRMRAIEERLEARTVLNKVGRRANALNVASLFRLMGNETEADRMERQINEMFDDREGG